MQQQLLLLASTPHADVGGYILQHDHADKACQHGQAAKGVLPKQPLQLFKGLRDNVDLCGSCAGGRCAGRHPGSNLTEGRQ